MAGSLLSEEEKQQYIADEIQRTTRGVKPSSGKKKAVILAGQPGSGKGTLAKRAMIAAEKTGGAVLIDPDESRANHPLYEQLARIDDSTAADKTHEDASAAAQASREAAMRQGLDLVIDGTLKTPANAERLVRELAAAGYEVEVVAVCVPLDVSWKGVQDRYENQKKQLGYGRTVPRDVHDAAAEGMVKSLEALRRQGLVKSIQIANRSGAVLFECAPSLEGPGASGAGSITSIFQQFGGRPSALADYEDISTSIAQAGQKAASIATSTPHQDAHAKEKAEELSQTPADGGCEDCEKKGGDGL